MRNIDIKFVGATLAALVIGLIWAQFNIASVGSDRGEAALRPLIWGVFSAPFALFLSWVVMRRNELGLAAFCCFCLYFFTFFVAARIESFAMSATQSAAEGHSFYFRMVLVVHAISGIGLSLWRALTPPAAEAAR